MCGTHRAQVGASTGWLCRKPTLCRLCSSASQDAGRCSCTSCLCIKVQIHISCSRSCSCSSCCCAVQVRFRLRHRPDTVADGASELPELHAPQAGHPLESDEQGRAFVGDLSVAEGSGVWWGGSE